jgi:cephalosporin-C deacetylase
MPSIDLTLDALRTYVPARPEPEDFDEFWSETLAQSAGPADIELDRVHTGIEVITTYSLTFAGYRGERVHGWVHVPTTFSGTPLPAVVQCIGYNGGRGLPHQWNLWATAGYVHVVLDTRGQGNGFCPGSTPDNGLIGPATGGFLTRGLESRESYYYRRAFVDAARIVDVARALEWVDPRRVAVIGTSQGGGLALAAAALSGSAAAVIADVPFLNDFRRAVEITSTDPFAEIRRYLACRPDDADRAFATLDYFDVSIMAGRTEVPGLFSAALMDSICPPSGVFAAFNGYAGEKQIEIYPMNDHEGGGPHFQQVQLSWLAGLFGK